MKKTISLILCLLIASAALASAPERIRTGENKSVPLSMGLSLLVPGAGQWFTEQKGLAIAFLGIEGLLIAGNIYMNNTGDLKVSQYEDYADLHWSAAEWLDTYDPVTDPTTHTSTVYVDGIPYSPQDISSYTLMKTDMENGYSSVVAERDYHFYENIGKYSQFKAGWDDWVAGGEDPGDPLNGIYGSYSDNQYTYSGMRANANVFLKAGNYIITAVICNHLTSAIQAGIVAGKLNSNGTSLAVHSMPIVTTQGHIGYGAGLTLSF